jgi:hypothetical protein
MKALSTLALLSIVALLGACAAVSPGGSGGTTSPSPTASSPSVAVGTEPAASGAPAAVTIDELVADPQAYAGREVILTATAVREVAPSAWLVGGETTADSTVLMLDNDLHPVVVGKGDTFEIHARVERFDDAESMTETVGALPDMYSPALAGYQGSYVLVASDLTTSGA